MSELYQQITYLLTHVLTPWCRILFERPIVTQPVEKYSAFFTEPERSLPRKNQPSSLALWNIS